MGSELKVDKQYIDACKVAKGLAPVNGFFSVASAEVGKEAEAAQNPPGAEAPTDKADADAKKAAKPNKKAESAGLSQPEKKEEKKKKLLGSSMQKQEDSLRQEIDAYKT